MATRSRFNKRRGKATKKAKAKAKRQKKGLRLKITEFRRNHRQQTGCGVKGCNLNRHRGGGVIFQPFTDAKYEVGALASGLQNTIMGTNDTSKI